MLRRDTSCLVLLVSSVFLSAASSPAALSHLEAELDAIIREGALALNTSFSVSVTDFNSGHRASSAHGIDDRASGKPISAASMFPVGSVTKTFLSVSALRLVEEGELDLDAPILPIVEPWLKREGLPSLAALWGSHSTLSLHKLQRVTSRMLLSMQSGIPDYDDLQMQVWTEEHPHQDFTPFDYLRNVSKEFMFTPGNGTMYSSNGYVVMGLVLAAVTHSSGWQGLDQFTAAGLHRVRPVMAHTTFMEKGRCSRYPGVVHQYAIKASAQQPRTLGAKPDAAQDMLGMAWTSLSQQCAEQPGKVVAIGSSIKQAPARSSDECCSLAEKWSASARIPMMWSLHHNGTCALYNRVVKVVVEPTGAVGPAGQWPDQCTSQGTKDGVVLVGHQAFTAVAPNKEKCCEIAQSWAEPRHLPVMWQYEGTQCVVFDHIFGMQRGNATIGRAGPSPPPPKPLSPDDLYDLYYASCLNGWTMGNIAISPSDVSAFYHSLFAKKIINATSVESMMNWHNMSGGWGASMRYGMGLLQFPNMQRDATGRPTNATYVIGHPGIDWGSSMLTVGWYPNLNLSLALATNSDGALNFTTGVYAGHGGGQGVQALTCRVVDAVVHFALPNHPPLSCPGYYDGIATTAITD